MTLRLTPKRTRFRQSLGLITFLLVLLLHFSPLVSATELTLGAPSTDENEIYWHLFYVARTGDVAFVIGSDEFRMLDNQFLQSLERMGLAHYPIDNSYPHEWRTFNFAPSLDRWEKHWGISYPLAEMEIFENVINYEDLIFDFSEGGVREKSSEEPAIEWHLGISFDSTTGELLVGYRMRSLYQLIGMGVLEGFMYQRGFCVLDGYPTLEDIWNNRYEGKYIFDLDEEKVRETTEEEKRAIWERWQRMAREAGMRAPEEARALPITTEPLPDNNIRATFQWSDYVMYIKTNSSVLGVRFDPTNKQFLIEISGRSGIPGKLSMLVPRVLVPSIDDVGVYLDGWPLDFTLVSVDNNYYSIHVEYTHSTRALVVNLIAFPAWYTQPINLVMIALAIAIVIGAVYWFKIRR